ncbi:hypothetical protein Trydic_g14725 [Trypoxylus dichotomus]
MFIALCSLRSDVRWPRVLRSPTVAEEMLRTRRDNRDLLQMINPCRLLNQRSDGISVGRRSSRRTGTYIRGRASFAASANAKAFTVVIHFVFNDDVDDDDVDDGRCSRLPTN